VFAASGLLVCWLVLTSGSVGLSAEPRVVGFERQTYALTHVQLVTAPGAEPVTGTLVMRRGLIESLGDVPVPRDAQVIDARGLVAYAGFVDCATSRFADPEKKPGSVAGRSVDFGRYVLAATRPDNAKGLTPQFESQSALKVADSDLAQYRAAGFTAIHVLPEGRLASGLGTLMSAVALPKRESLLRPQTLSCLRLFAHRGQGYPTTLMGGIAHLRQTLLDAQRHTLHQQIYRNHPGTVQRPAIDPVLENFGRILAGQTRTVFSVQTRDDVHRSLDFCAEFGLRPTLWMSGNTGAALQRLKLEKLDVIAQLDFGKQPKIEPVKLDQSLQVKRPDPERVQQQRQQDWREQVQALHRLEQLGLRFGLSTRGLKSPEQVLANLRQAIGHGLSPDAALAALTTHPAAMLDMQHHLGTLEPGKLAHVVVMSGPLAQEQSQVRYVFVDGRKFEYHAAPTPDSDKPAVASQRGPAPPPTPVTPADTVDLTGRWELRLDKKKQTRATLNLEQVKNRIRGTFRSGTSRGSIKSAEWNGGQLKLVVSVGDGDGSLQLRFTGRLQDGVLTGKLTPPFGAVVDWSARRTTAGSGSTGKSANVAGGPGKPSEQAKPKSSPSEQPTELDSDRKRRGLKTAGRVLIRNATVLTGTGQTLQRTSVLVKSGKIAAIGTDLKPEPEMTVIDAAGRYLMPGIIDTHSHIMISGGVNESSQSIVPEVRVADVVNSEDVSEYRALAGGVTTARLLHGSANVIGGQDAVVKLRFGETAAQHRFSGSHQGVKFALGENVKFRQTRFPNTRLGVEATLNRAFLEAIDYRRVWQAHRRAERESGTSAAQATRLPPRRDLRLETLAKIVDHEVFIHSHCYRADEILMLLRVASNLGIRVWSLQHVLEGYKVAPEIVEHGASCSTFSDWWAYKVEAYDATPYNAALLKEAGANVVIKSDDRELIRHLYSEAAKTVRYGNMHPDHALQTITLNAARELGISDRVGSIEIGKDADLALFSGHPLNAFSRCEMTLIDGEVWFSREHAVSAMSAQARQRSDVRHPLRIPDADVRSRRLDLERLGSGRFAIVGAELHPVDRPPIANGTLLVAEGRIVALGADLQVPEGVQILQARGLQVYPGLIDSGSTLGLVEIKKVSETQDHAESGGLQPDLRAGVAINPDSELIPVARAGGVTTVLISPSGGIISGQASLAKLSGWTAPEMVVRLEAGLHINWPNSVDSRALKELTGFLDQGRQYQALVERAGQNQAARPIADPRLDALRPYLSGEKPVFVEANSRQQIAEALLFAEQQNLKIVIAGATDAWKLAGELKARDVPVIVGPVMRSPVAGYDPYDAPYANPGRLHEAGVRFCIRSNNAANCRNTPFEAAMAVAYGLPEAAALRAVTLSAAEILGVADQIGSLSPGKRADLIITDGSPLQQTTQIKAVFIAGEAHQPTSRHSRLYHRYRRRLHEVRAKQPK